MKFIEEFYYGTTSPRKTVLQALKRNGWHLSKENRVSKAFRVFKVSKVKKVKREIRATKETPLLTPISPPNSWRN